MQDYFHIDCFWSDPEGDYLSFHTDTWPTGLQRTLKRILAAIVITHCDSQRRSFSIASCSPQRDGPDRSMFASVDGIFSPQLPPGTYEPFGGTGPRLRPGHALDSAQHAVLAYDSASTHRAAMDGSGVSR